MSKRGIHQSLIFKVSLAIVLAQVFVMAAVGAYYIDRFSSQIDKRVLTQIKAPAQLMNSGILSFEAISQPDAIRQIVGSDILDAMIIGPDNIVYYSAQATDIGLNVSQIPRVTQGLFQGAFGDTVFGRDTDDNYVSLSPIYSAAGRAPFLAVYIKAASADIQKEKTTLLYLFVFGSLLAALLISVVNIVSFKLTLFRGLTRLTAATREIGGGESSEATMAGLPQTQDEIGDLAQAFRNMALEIGKSRASLQGYSKQLEQDVAARTAELNGKIAELERLNQVMIGRELRMVELKETVRELEEKLKAR